MVMQVNKEVQVCSWFWRQVLRFWLKCEWLQGASIGFVVEVWCVTIKEHWSLTCNAGPWTETRAPGGNQINTGTTHCTTVPPNVYPKWSILSLIIISMTKFHVCEWFCGIQLNSLLTSLSSFQHEFTSWKDTPVHHWLSLHFMTGKV